VLLLELLTQLLLAVVALALQRLPEDYLEVIPCLAQLLLVAAVVVAQELPRGQTIAVRREGLAVVVDLMVLAALAIPHPHHRLKVVMEETVPVLRLTMGLAVVVEHPLLVQMGLAQLEVMEALAQHLLFLVRL